MADHMSENGLTDSEAARLKHIRERLAAYRTDPNSPSINRAIEDMRFTANLASRLSREQAKQGRTCTECGGPLSDARNALGLESCSGPCNVARRRRLVAENKTRGVAEDIAYEHAVTVDNEFGCCHDAAALRAGGRVPEFDGDAFEPLPEDCPGRLVLVRHLTAIGIAVSTSPASTPEEGQR